MNGVLYAFWHCSPDTGVADLLPFLAGAEIVRQRGRYDSLSLVLCDEGATDHSASGSDDDAAWHLWNDMAAAVWLLPTLGGLTICREPSEVAEAKAVAGPNMFPVMGGTGAADGRHFHGQGGPAAAMLADAAAEGAAILPLRSSVQGRQYAEDWLRERAKDRLVVTLALGPSASAGDRMSAVATSWRPFLQSLDPERVAPIVVAGSGMPTPAFDSAWRPASIYAEAACNIELRMALFEASDLVVCDHPLSAAMCLFSPNVRCAVFDDSGAVAVPPALPATKAIIRAAASASTLRDAYRRMADILVLPPLSAVQPASAVV